jgi:hypothetical protein
LTIRKECGILEDEGMNPQEKIMPAKENNGGDVLARGGTRCTFKPAGAKKTQEEWDAMFEGASTASEFVAKRTPKVKAQKADKMGNIVRD